MCYVRIGEYTITKNYPQWFVSTPMFCLSGLRSEDYESRLNEGRREALELKV